MTETTKNTRRELWQGKNFAGSIDWAVDLQRFTDDDKFGPDDLRPDMPPSTPLEDCNGNYGKLEDVPRDAPSHCRNLYILQALKQNLTDALVQYDDLMEGGYDRKFDTYAEAVARSGNKQIENFMYNNGSNYFDCVITESYTCCDHCEYYRDKYGDGPDSKECKYCEDYDCGWDSICDSPEGNFCTIETKYKDVPGPCPPDYSQRSEDAPKYGGYAMSAVTWKLRDNKKDEFWGDFFLETGIEEEDVKWKSIERYPCIPAESDEECAKHNHDHNFPVTDGYTKEDVLNPKDVVEEARGNLNSLGPDLGAVISQLKKGIFLGSSYDLVDGLSLPILMIDDAIDNMQQIDDTVDEWEEEKRKNILMAFLSAIFFFVPVIGQVVGTVAALANVGRILLMAGIAGNVAIGIHDIVDDPGNAPLAIFGLVLEPFAIFDIAKISKAANVRRAMSPDDIAALGAKSSGKSKVIDDIQNVCTIRRTRRDLPRGVLPMSSLTGRQYDFMDGVADWI